MSKIRYETFDGIAPVVAPRELGPVMAQKCENVDLGGKRLDPWKIPLLVQAAVEAVSIYPWRRNSSTEWLSWATDVDVIQGPTAEDDYERIYFTDGVKPQVIGWDTVKTQRDMERPVASSITVTAADRTGFGDTEMAGATAVWGGTLTGTYNKTVGGVISQETMTPAAVNFIGTVISRYRDKNTGAWTVEFSFPTIPIWHFSGSSGTRITDIAVELTGAWTITLNGSTVTASSAITLNDGSVDYGTALLSSALPTPAYKIGKATVTGVAFTGSIVFIPTFYDCNTIRSPRYVQTWVNDWGMEGPESSISDLVTWAPGQKIVLSGLGSVASTITKRRIYRSVAGSVENTYYFLVELDAGTTTYTDILTDAAIAVEGGELPNLENPPDDIKGIVMLPANFAAAFRGRELLFSEPDYPWSWPDEYRVTVDWNIVGLGVNGNDLYIMTEGQPYVASGYHPESLKMAKIAIPQACVAKRSIAPLGPLMVYASPDGLVGLQGAQARLLTAPFYGRTEWQALTPTGMISAVHDDCYFGFHATGGIMFWLGKGGDSMATTDQVVTEAYFDLVDDTLYIVQSASIYSWNRGATYLTMTWRGKEWASDRRQDWNSCRIEAEVYPVTLNLYSENSLVQTISVTSRTSQRIPIQVPQRTWSIEVQSALGAINMVTIGTSMQELVTK